MSGVNQLSKTSFHSRMDGGGGGSGEVGGPGWFHFMGESPGGVWVLVGWVGGWRVDGDGGVAVVQLGSHVGTLTDEALGFPQLSSSPPTPSPPTPVFPEAPAEAMTEGP